MEKISTKEFLKKLEELVENNKISKEQKEQFEYDCAYVQMNNPDVLEIKMNEILSQFK